MIFDTTFDANPCYNHQGKKKKQKEKKKCCKKNILVGTDYFIC